MPEDDDVTRLLPRADGESDESYAERLAALGRQLEARAVIERSRGTQSLDVAQRVIAIERDLAALRRDLDDICRNVDRLDDQAQALHRDYLPAFRRDLVKEITESVRSILQEERSRPGVLAAVNVLLSTIAGSKYLAGGVGVVLFAIAVSILANTGYTLATEWVQLGPNSPVAIVPETAPRRVTPEPQPEPVD